ncbi:hypothetical protein [Pseudoclavibacter sp. AY1H1]|uniref:hypothetical protein n=1 Tax=Pseudoclavibacter sp. AY1H1 TaxID=2080584 RepID=UPI000CE84353|nr:hypothetical protein [Pseudoclavibacter sp. AY1H1]PPF37020.1 hypothetical protein C5E05_08660 [Pseudoclavibacter sp. AY1H1]
MKAIDLTLNAVIAVTVTVFLAYLGFHLWDFGIFTTLPPDITGFFLDNAALQYIALGMLVAAMIAKVPVGRRIKTRDAETRR